MSLSGRRVGGVLVGRMVSLEQSSGAHGLPDSQENGFRMMADGHLVGDGSWNLRVRVTNLDVERTLRVKGDLHIGGVMLKLVEDLGEYRSRPEVECLSLWIGESIEIGKVYCSVKVHLQSSSAVVAYVFPKAAMFRGSGGL
ncbi:hypothetical protein J437_LFUL003578 [Ladona fulva]|uniref:Kindlin-2 N-terminal domain-containing protein n=1 Tax=Ladona fulva TaxID=123851 RepID=A0A8K0JWL0_LADFU|nr:hypothetical protein J437_LFUL003578 [Ladona fulva]